MREELKASLQGRREDALRERARLAASSAVTLLGRVLAFAGVKDERDWAPDLRPDRVPSPDAGTRIRAVGRHG